MTSHAIRVALLLSVLPAVGCGTAANLIGAGPGKKVPFGGVAHDMRSLNQVRDGEYTVGWGRHQWEPQPHQQVGLMILCAADLPLSLIGDVVTWPYARAYTYINQPNDFPPIAVATPPGGPGVPAAPVGPAYPLPAIPRAPVDARPATGAATPPAGPVGTVYPLPALPRVPVDGLPTTTP